MGEMLFNLYKDRDAELLKLMKQQKYIYNILEDSN